MAINKTKTAAAKKAPAKSAPKAAPAKSKALAKRGSSAMQSGGLALLSTLAGKGTENITAQDKGMPYLKLLQDLNPETKKRNDKYVDGAAPGMFYHTGNRELYEESVRIIPIYFKSVVQEWWPRNHANSGLVATHDSMTEAKRKKAHEDTVLSLTHMHFVLAWSEEKEEWSPCIIACDRSKLSPSKQLVALIDNYQLEFNGETFKAPAFARSYELIATESQKGDYTFYSFTVSPGEDVFDDEDLMVHCNTLVDDFQRGAVKVDYTMGEGTATSHDSEIDEDDV